MRPTRRSVITGLLAAGMCPISSWADAGAPAYLAAARLPDGSFSLSGLTDTGTSVFKIPLPDRGHAAAAHPFQPLAVAFARRPGTFALVIDCTNGKTQAHLDSPVGIHFSGHGCFSADGAYMFTSENDFVNGQGLIGVWSTAQGFRRVASFPSGGVGPHDLQMMPDGRTLVVANGGIDTHPDSGRAKLNIPTMQPNLTYLSRSGEIVEQVEPPKKWHKNSLRHLAISKDGLVAIGTQWQGDVASTPPLLATHRQGDTLKFHDSGYDLERRMKGYVGSVAIRPDGTTIAMTSPRGNLACELDVTSAKIVEHSYVDVSGVAIHNAGFAWSTGNGRLVFEGSEKELSYDCSWDNHLVKI